MQYRENPMFGRKVFFLNPPLSIENFVVDGLKDLEYEVYIIREYSLAKPVLKHYENAICFIYIDDELSLDGWYNFIKSFETDEDVKSIFLGVLSIKTKPKDQERFLMNLKLPGGFVMLDQKPEDVFKQLEGILNINGAKGVRKVIRLDLKNSKDVNGYFSNGSTLYSFRLVDISSLGFAAVTPARMSNVFKKGSFLKNVSVTMGRYSFVCTIMVYDTKIVGDTCTVVAILADNTPIQIKRKIHDFVYETLERRNRIFMEDLAHDFTDYSIAPVTFSKEGDDVEDAVEVDEEGKEKPADSAEAKNEGAAETPAEESKAEAGAEEKTDAGEGEKASAEETPAESPAETPAEETPETGAAAPETE